MILRSLSILNLIIVLGFTVGIGVYNNLCESCDDGLSLSEHSCCSEEVHMEVHSCCTDIPMEKEDCPSEFQLLSFDVLNYETVDFKFIKVKSQDQVFPFQLASFIANHRNESTDLEHPKLAYSRFKYEIQTHLYSKSSRNIFYQNLKIDFA